MGIGLTNGFTGHRVAERVPRWLMDRMCIFILCFIRKIHLEQAVLTFPLEQLTHAVTVRIRSLPLLWGWLINEGGGNHTVNMHTYQTSIVHHFSFECTWTLCVNLAYLHACLCLLNIPCHWSADNTILQDSFHRPQTPTPRLFWQLVPRNTSHVTPGNECVNVCMCYRGGDTGNAAAWSSADLRLVSTELESLDSNPTAQK